MALNLLFFGDIHGDFAPVVDKAYEEELEAIILLGDQCPEETMDKILARVRCPVYFILGNHDSDRPLWLRNHFPAWEQNIGLKIVTIAGFRIAALPGVFRGQIWHPKEGIRWHTRQDFMAHMRRGSGFENGLPLKHWTSIFPEDFDVLVKQGPADILACHEAPSNHRHGFREIDELAGLLQVKTIVHGHQHEYYEDKLENGTKVVGLNGHGIFYLQK